MAKQPSKTKKQRIKKQPDEVKKYNPHKSFRRTYREDYQRDLKVPGIMHHIVLTFKTIFKNWKLFLPFLIISVVVSIALIGITSESTYKQIQEAIEQASIKTGGGEIGTFGKAGLILFSVVTSGGFMSFEGEGTVIFGIIMFLVIWLVTIFIVRHRLAKHNIKLRDALYNAMTPLLSSFVILVIVLIECIPIVLFLIALSAAVKTEFLATPFYALLFFVFAALMILLSAYLLSSSVIALIAVSAPGLYPIPAMKTASELMMGRRTRFVLRLIALILAMMVLWAIIMIPLIMFDLAMKNFDWAAGIPFIPICLMIMTYFTMIYSSVYLYLYYRWLLKN